MWLEYPIPIRVLDDFHYRLTVKYYSFVMLALNPATRNAQCCDSDWKHFENHEIWHICAGSANLDCRLHQLVDAQAIENPVTPDAKPLPLT